MNEKDTLDLIQLYLKLDDMLKELYYKLGMKKRFPFYLRDMWKDLEEEEDEHILYWHYLEDQRYNLAIFTQYELKQNISKLNQLIQFADKLTCDVGDSVVAYTECFDQTVNLEFEILISPMQRVFYNHDIIFEKIIFNPLQKYELHLRHITNAATKLYPKDSIKLVLVKSFLKIKKQKDIMNRETVNDSLTGVNSRKYFFDNAKFLLKIAQREMKPVSLVMMDINKFKEINDKYGHLAGDKVLKNIGGLINNCVRTTDIAARYGGDEFSLILYNQDEEKTQTFLSRLKKEISSARINVAKNKYINPEVSMGYAIYSPVKKANLGELLKRADKRMYEDKRQLERSYQLEDTSRY